MSIASPDCSTPAQGNTCADTGETAHVFDFRAHLVRQRRFSEKAFGPGKRTEGNVEHIRKELEEILAKPDDVEEWIDVAILALDGAWRHGASPEEIISMLQAKQAKNEKRQWPDWRTMSENHAICHVKNASGSELQTGGAS